MERVDIDLEYFGCVEDIGTTIVWLGLDRPDPFRVEGFLLSVLQHPREEANDAPRDACVNSHKKLPGVANTRANSQE